MACHNPTAQGFRAIREEPVVFLAEICWRWLFGAVALAFVSWTLLVFLDAVEVSKANLFLLRSLNPDAIAYAIQRMFAGKGPMMVTLLCIAGPSLTVLWVVTATIGRIATTRVLLERSAHVHGTSFSLQVRWAATGVAQLVRALLVWMGAVAYVASVLIASYVARSGEEFHTGVFILLFLLLFMAAVVLLSTIHWVLGIAPVFVLRDGAGAGTAIARAWRVTRQRAGQFAAMNLWHGIFRLAWLAAVSTVAGFPLVLLQVIPGKAVAILMGLMTLAYFAGADFLFAARYAGYVEILEQQRLKELGMEPSGAEPRIPFRAVLSPPAT